ncbi:MAG: SIS domain-containing protein [Anaerolineae bacterium]|nr:SIS domain-containing protein [Anaerolineae bacterium]
MTTHTSHLQREILEQPEVLRRLLAAERDTIARIAAAIRAHAPPYAVIAARGTSDNAARYAQYLLGAENGLTVSLATPSLYTLYRRPPRMSGALVIGISQSGASPDIVAVVDEGRRQGALTVAITNDAGSPLAQAAAHTIELHAGEERSVAATKTYTASLGAVAALSALLAQDDARWQALEGMPAIAEEVLAQIDEVSGAAARYRDMHACAVIGRGYNYATAFEIALKLTELTYTLSMPFSAADFQHGPIALVEPGFPVLAIVPEGAVAGEMRDMLAQLQERGAALIVLSPLVAALDLAQTALPLPPGVPEWLSPLVAVMPGQLFALGSTLARGLDPDRPRGLRKVTLTR